MRYNPVCLGEQNTGALCVSKAAYLSQLSVVGKVPSANGYRFALAVRLDNGSAIRGGHFAMGNGLIDETGNRYGRLVVKKQTLSPNGESRAYWLCLCDCGEEVVASGKYLRNGTVKSCGCFRRDFASKIGKKSGPVHGKKFGGQNALKNGESAFRRLFKDYKRRARQSSMQFTLTRSQFRALTSQSCHYCGADPDSVYDLKRYKGSHTYNGLDRKDNDKGYTVENSVPCCRTCNWAKGTKSYKEFINYLNQLVAFRNALDAG